MTLQPHQCTPPHFLLGRKECSCREEQRTLKLKAEIRTLEAVISERFEMADDLEDYDINS